MIGPVILQKIEQALASVALSTRGGFTFADAEHAPIALVRPARAVILIGNIGAAFWPHFEEWRRAGQYRGANPLDTWTRTVVDPIAEASGARALYPSDKPYQPFQRWAMRAEGLKPSPLGLLIHPRYGLWHAYRAALLFEEPLEFGPTIASEHPCEACAEQPCLKSCPVEAHSAKGFDAASCRDFQVADPTSDCRMSGCLDRNACPIGEDYRYPPAFQAFLANAFIGVRL